MDDPKECVLRALSVRGGCCGETQGPVSLLGTLQRVGHVPGERLAISAEIDNQSAATIVKLRTRLVQHVVCYSQQPECKMHESAHQVAAVSKDLKDDPKQAPCLSVALPVLIGTVPIDWTNQDACPVRRNVQDPASCDGSPREAPPPYDDANGGCCSDPPPSYEVSVLGRTESQGEMANAEYLPRYAVYQLGTVHKIERVRINRNRLHENVFGVLSEVSLLLDTLPILGDVVVLCFFVFFVFAIVGVQLWSGILRNRCIPDTTVFQNLSSWHFPHAYYIPDYPDEGDYICSSPKHHGVHTCSDLPLTLSETGIPCNGSIEDIVNLNNGNGVGGCINWNQYYNICKPTDDNPFGDTISFDNILTAFVTMFVSISMDGWIDVMYHVQEAYSVWVWLYFVLLIVVGSFYMVNLFLAVIATQFAETKVKETEKIAQEKTSQLLLTTIDVMLKCLANVRVFMVLLFLFIFIFTLLGMVLFGAKFCNEEDGSVCYCQDFLNSTCRCARDNFDSFFQASLTVFVILSGTYADVLFEAMSRLGALTSIYFIALVVFGNYIMLNLLICILLEGFEETDEKKGAHP